MYIVVHGRARFKLNGDEIDASAGTMVFIRDPAIQREATAEEAGTPVLAVGGKPGAPYETSAWETVFLRHPCCTGRARRGRGNCAVRGEALAERPDHVPLLYNLACTESRAGRGLTTRCSIYNRP